VTGLSLLLLAFLPNNTKKKKVANRRHENYFWV